MSVALDLPLYDTPAVPGVSGVPGVPARRRLHSVPEALPLEAPARAGSVRVLHAPTGREAAAPVRLTRRGVVVLAVLVAAVGGALVWLAALSAPSGSPAVAVPATVTVHSGDTLWSIASRYAGDRDPRAVVADLQTRNHIVDAQVVPGQLLHLR